MPIEPQLHLAIIQALLVAQLLLPLAVVMVAENPITVEMERLAALVVEEGLMQPLHRAVLELPDKVIKGAHNLVQIKVNQVAEAVLVLLELAASIMGIQVEMAGLD
jgi:hypothetical protein